MLKRRQLESYALLIDETEFWDLSVRKIAWHVHPIFWTILEKQLHLPIITVILVRRSMGPMRAAPEYTSVIFLRNK